jgi:hypothetical protein
MIRKKKWELLADFKPTQQGYYWTGTLEYPDEYGRRKGVCYRVLWLKTSELATGMQDQCGDSPERIVWYGPIEQPEIKDGELRRVIKAQEDHFVATHYKHCEDCGWQSGLNSRSIGYLGQREDCPVCRGQNGENTVSIKEKT